MTTRVRLTADVDPDVKKRVRIAAIESDTSVSEWVERALREKLRQSEPGEIAESGRRYIAPGLSLPPEGAKPRGSTHPPRLRGHGGTISDAVIEDRR